MSIEVKVPALGESIVEATVGRWLKQQGDSVATGEALVELETDKVNMEVNAPESGTLGTIARNEGDTVGIGDLLATIDSAHSLTSANKNGKESGEPETGPTTPTSSSTDGENATGSIQTPTEPVEESAEGNRSTPLARRIAAEHGVDINRIKGSGPSGRVTKDDVTAFIDSDRGPASPDAQGAARVPSRESEAPESTPSPRTDDLSERKEERVRMSRRRQTIARRLVEAQQTAAMLTTFNEIDMTAVMDLRKRRRDAFKERHGINLGFMSFFTKAVVGALKEYPRLNAELQGDEMILKRYYDIGIAVGTDEGLVVPVVRNADALTFAEIESQVADLAIRARKGTLGLAELQGGTFTITNGGIYGSLLSTPILNTPQVGILGMHKIQERPMAVNGEVVVRPMMYVALSYDHRIVDGSEAVRFLVRLKDLLEDPGLLLIEG